MGRPHDCDRPFWCRECGYLATPRGNAARFPANYRAQQCSDEMTTPTRGGAGW